MVPLLGRELHRVDLPFEVLLAELQSPVDKVALEKKKKDSLFLGKSTGLAKAKMGNEMSPVDKVALKKGALLFLGKGMGIAMTKLGNYMRNSEQC